MRKALLVLAAMVVGIFLAAQSAFAWVIVGDYGDTGWQTFSHTFSTNDGAWTGQIGFLVSNVDDEDFDSVLLIDNLNVKDAAGASLLSNGFGSGTLAGFTSSGTVEVVESAAAASGTVYNSTDGNSYMAKLTASGTDTSAYFSDEYFGTDGAILWLDEEQTFEVGYTVSFDWAFLAMDYAPFNDFSLLLHPNSTGDEVDYYEYDGLGKIGGSGVVPEPASMVLLGIGLAGAGLARRRKRA
ncbi:MAG: PEP-CTERM sorting domain-containing protein [Candidatus Omnitrophica bacterium]|nr:PEP-CTERM sorting domain-containing protein [Candidatus Omnitrophota bacterium]